MHPGDTLGRRYRLTDRITDDEVGELWRADDTLLSRTVAVEILNPNLSSNPELRDQFRTLATTLASLDHPGVIEVFDYAEDSRPDGAPVAYTVMAHVDAQRLSGLLDRGPLAPDTALRTIADIAEALEQVHRTGIVHNSLSASTILVREDGSIVITGFTPPWRPAGTMPDPHLATYLSPEQLAGQPATPAGNIYSLGVIGYHTLAGVPPFQPSEAADLVSRHQYERPPRLPEEIPLSVNAMIMRALAKDPTARFRSAAAMAGDCRQIDRTQAIPVSPPPAKSDGSADTPMLRPSPTSQPPTTALISTLPAGGTKRPRPAGPIVIDRTGHASSEPEPPQPEPRRSRAAVSVLTVCVIAMIAATLVLIRFWGPDDDPTNTGSDTVTHPSLNVPFDPSSPTPEESSSSSSSPSPSISDTDPTPEESSSSPPEPTTPGSSPTTDDPPSEPEPMVTVPDVVGMSRDAAVDALSAEGFEVSVHTIGGGDVSCSVSGQDPAGDSEAHPGTTVTIDVPMVDDEADCDGGSGTTAAGWSAD